VLAFRTAQHRLELSKRSSEHRVPQSRQRPCTSPGEGHCRCFDLHALASGSTSQWTDPKGFRALLVGYAPLCCLARCPPVRSGVSRASGNPARMNRFDRVTQAREHGTTPRVRLHLHACSVQPAAS
jgi:hypothetical protein